MTTSAQRAWDLHLYVPWAKKSGECKVKGILSCALTSVPLLHQDFFNSGLWLHRDLPPVFLVSYIIKTTNF